jgi:hypothetical protein
MPASLLKTASQFLPLNLGFLPLLFFTHHRLVGTPKHASAAWIFVFLLGPLAALAASLGIYALALEYQNHPLHIAQNALQSLVEFGCTLLSLSMYYFRQLVS